MPQSSNAQPALRKLGGFPCICGSSLPVSPVMRAGDQANVVPTHAVSIMRLRRIRGVPDSVWLPGYMEMH